MDVEVALRMLYLVGEAVTDKVRRHAYMYLYACVFI